jgi:YbbR domain-containing protein
LDEIRGKIARKSKFESQLRVKLKKSKIKDLFTIGTLIRGPNLVENRGEIKEIRSLKVN